MTLPELHEGWQWSKNSLHGTWAACLLTFEYDCFVNFYEGSIHISTGAAPWEIVHAVMVANGLTT